MDKPELKDFGLNENSLKLYQKQKEEYEKNQHLLKPECEKYNSQLLIAIIIMAAVIFVIPFFVIVFSDFENQNTVDILLLIIFIIALVISIVCRRVSKNEIDFGEYWLMFFILPVVGFCIIIYRALEKNEKVDKYSYIDKKLEEKAVKYLDKLVEYEESLRLKSFGYWENMIGYEFEHAVADLYRKLGYKARVTPATGDGGVDIILEKDYEKIAVQCKHHANPVGPNDFRALIGVVVSGGYDFGIFVSLSGFTQGVFREQANSRIKIELVTVLDLVTLANGFFGGNDDAPKNIGVDIIENKNDGSGKLVNVAAGQKSIEKNTYISTTDLIGAIVYYEKYGPGWIKSIEENKIIIKFNKEPVLKAFLWKSLGKKLKILSIDGVPEDEIENVNNYFIKQFEDEKAIVTNDGISTNTEYEKPISKEIMPYQIKIKKERGYYRGKSGFEAYNYKGQNIGLIFKTDDKRTPAYGNIELCVYKSYQLQYGEWRRIKSQGVRIKYSYLCKVMENNDEYVIDVDNL